MVTRSRSGASSPERSRRGFVHARSPPSVPLKTVFEPATTCTATSASRSRAPGSARRLTVRGLPVWLRIAVVPAWAALPGRSPFASRKTPDCATSSSPVGAIENAASAPRSGRTLGSRHATSASTTAPSPSTKPSARIVRSYLFVVLTWLDLRWHSGGPYGATPLALSELAGLLVVGLERERVTAGRQRGGAAVGVVVVLQRQRESVDERVVLVPLCLAPRERRDAVGVRVLRRRERAERPGVDVRLGGEGAAAGEGRARRGALLDREVDVAAEGVDRRGRVELDVGRQRAVVGQLDALLDLLAGLPVRDRVHRAARVVVGEVHRAGREAVAGVRRRAREGRERAEPCHRAGCPHHQERHEELCLESAHCFSSFRCPPLSTCH